MLYSCIFNCSETVAMVGETLDVNDKRFRIKPHQQMMASCTGALLTATMGKIQAHVCKERYFLCRVLVELRRIFCFSNTIGRS